MSIATTFERIFESLDARVKEFQAAKPKFDSDYEAARQVLLTDLKNHVSAHQALVDTHTAEVKAGNDLIAKLSGAAAAAVVVPQLVLSTAKSDVSSAWSSITGWVKGNYQWVVSGGSAAALVHWGFHWF